MFLLFAIGVCQPSRVKCIVGGMHCGWNAFLIIQRDKYELHTANKFLNSLSRTLNGRFVTCSRFGPSPDELPMGDVVELDVEGRLDRVCCCCCGGGFSITGKACNVLEPSILIPPLVSWGEVMTVLMSAFFKRVLFCFPSRCCCCVSFNFFCCTAAFGCFFKERNKKISKN